MKGKILRYNKNLFSFDIEIDGRIKHIDLFTDYSYKGFGKITNKTDYDKFIGKTVEIESLFPWIEFASKVKLLN